MPNPEKEPHFDSEQDEKEDADLEGSAEVRLSNFHESSDRGSEGKTLDFSQMEEYQKQRILGKTEYETQKDLQKIEEALENSDLEPEDSNE